MAFDDILKAVDGNNALKELFQRPLDGNWYC